MSGTGLGLHLAHTATRTQPGTGRPTVRDCNECNGFGCSICSPDQARLSLLILEGGATKIDRPANWAGNPDAPLPCAACVGQPGSKCLRCGGTGWDPNVKDQLRNVI